MPYTKPDDFPDDFKAEREQLRSFLRYFATPTTAGCGRKYFKYHGMVFWPDFLSAVLRSTGWFERFYPPREADQRRQHRGVPKSGPAFATWRAKDIRREVERLLRPLRIPTTSLVGGDYVTYALEARGTGEDRIDDVNPERWSSLNDPKNYTYFRLIAPNDLALTRVMLDLTPFRDVQKHQAALPPEIVALYYAWRTLAQRHRKPFDPEQVGVEWTNRGYIFINWKRFFASEFRPPVEATAAECAAFLRGGHRKGRYRLRLSAFPSPLKHKNIPAQTRAVNADDFAMLAEPYSLADPLYLEARPELFDSTYHNSRERAARRKRAGDYDKLKKHREGMQQDPDAPKHRSKQAHLHTFIFRPYEHLPPQCASFEKPVWFEPDYDEKVYAITFNKQFYFAAPELLTKKLADRAPNELQAWFYAMDCLACVEQFTESGHVGNALDKSRSEQINNLKEREYKQTAAAIIENFLSLDDLTSSEMKRVRRKTAERIGQDPDTPYAGSRWYQEMVLSTAHRGLTASSVRRRAFAFIPGRNKGEPKLWPFYSAGALKQFQAAAKGMDTVRDDRPVAPPEEVAPYVYAWATFCLLAGNAGLIDPVKEPGANGHWTPEEDYILIRHYRAHPRMKRHERVELLRKLPRHNWRALTRRAYQLNQLLEQVLSAPRLQHYVVGKLWVPEANSEEQRDQEAKRLALIVGVGHFLRYNKHELHRNVGYVNDAMKLTHDALAKIALPYSYRSEQFATLVRG